MGYLYVVLSSIFFGIMPSVQNKAMLNGAEPLNVTLVCHGVCLTVVFLLCLYKKIDLRLTKKEFLIYVFSGGFGLFVTDLCLNLAYTKMPVGMVTMVHFTYPVLVCFGGVLFFGEKMNLYKISAIILSVTGLFLLSGSGNVADKGGVIIALISAFAYAMNLMIIDHSAISGHSSLKKNFYIFLFSYICSMLVSASDFGSLHFEANQMIWMIIAGLIMMAGSVFLTLGIKLIGSSDTAFISTLEPITSVLFSALIYHYALEARSIIGCILIILSLIPIIIDED